MKRSMSFFMCIVVAFTFMGGFFFDSFAVTAEAASYKTPYYYKQLSEKEGVTEALKAENQMLWVQRMNNP